MTDGNGHIPLNGNGKKPHSKPKRGWGYRPLDKVIENRISEACAVIAQKPSSHRCDLHRLFEKRWVNQKGEPCHWKTIDRILVRAKQRLQERTKRPKDAWIDDILAGYDRDISDTDPRVRLAARIGIRQMLGLDAPNRTELSGPNGTAVRIESSANSQRLAAVVLEEIEARVKLGLKLNGGGTGMLTHETPVIDVEAKPNGNGGNGHG